MSHHGPHRTRRLPAALALLCLPTLWLGGVSPAQAAGELKSLKKIVIASVRTEEDTIPLALVAENRFQNLVRSFTGGERQAASFVPVRMLKAAYDQLDQLLVGMGVGVVPAGEVRKQLVELQVAAVDATPTASATYSPEQQAQIQAALANPNLPPEVRKQIEQTLKALPQQASKYIHQSAVDMATGGQPGGDPVAEADKTPELVVIGEKSSPPPIMPRTGTAPQCQLVSGLFAGLERDAHSQEFELADGTRVHVASVPTRQESLQMQGDHGTAARFFYQMLDKVGADGFMFVMLYPGLDKSTASNKVGLVANFYDRDGKQLLGPGRALQVEEPPAAALKAGDVVAGMKVAAAKAIKQLMEGVSP